MNKRKENNYVKLAVWVCKFLLLRYSKSGSQINVLTGLFRYQLTSVDVDMLNTVQLRK